MPFSASFVIIASLVVLEAGFELQSLICLDLALELKGLGLELNREDSVCGLVSSIGKCFLNFTFK